LCKAKWGEITTFGFLMQKSQDLHQLEAAEIVASVDAEI